MSEQLKDILSHLSTEVDQETLLLYLQGKLSAEKQHELEKQMLDNEFAADALEGLQNMKDQKQIDFLVDQLNRDLRKKTARKKADRDRRKLRFDPALALTLFILLLLIVLCFMILQKVMR